MIDDEHQFFLFRQKLLAQPTRPQGEVAKRVAQIKITKQQLSNVINDAEHNEQPICTVTVTRKDDKFNNTLFVHSKHEARLAGVKRNIHEIHNDIFKNTLVGDIRLIVGNRNNSDMDYELTCKRPPSHLLKDEPPKKKSNYFSINN